MKTFGEMTTDEQLANVRTWNKYYKDKHDAVEAKVDRLEAINAELLVVLGDIVEIHRRDNTDDPDKIATDRWRHEVWSNAYFITKAEATP